MKILATTVILMCLIVMIPMKSTAQWSGPSGTVVEVTNVKTGDVTKDGKKYDYYQVNVYEGHHVDPLYKLDSWEVTRDVFGEDARPYNPFVEGLTPSYRENSECKPGIYRANVNTRHTVPWIQFGTKYRQKDDCWSIDERFGLNIHPEGDTSLGCPSVKEDYEGFFQAVNNNGSLDNGQVTVVIRDRWDSSNDLQLQLQEKTGLHLYGELGGVDFTSIQFNYISSQDAGDFEFMIKATKAEESSKVVDIESAIGTALDFFFIGLTLSNSRFWVNLNPWEPERIVDEDVVITDVGRIMLEADLQMKRDFCKHENPCQSEIGEKYWSSLDNKREQLVKECMNNYPGQIEDTDNVLFSAATRHWIIPDEIIACGNGNEIYIIDATLDIYSEPVYEHSTFDIVNQSKALISEDCLGCLSEAVKEYGRYAMELEEELVLPLVVKEINSGQDYSDLRQVYVSLALAQWYKEYAGDQHVFSDFIDSSNLIGLESEATWNSKDIWLEYVKSYKEGEYRCEKTHTYRTEEHIVTETNVYISGGVDFGDIGSHISVVGTIDPKIEEAITSAMHIPFVNIDNDYYLGDCLYVLESASLTALGGDEQPAEVSPTPTPTPTPKQDGFGCSIPASGAGSSIDGGVIPALGIPLAIGVFNYFRKRRRS